VSGPGNDKLIGFPSVTQLIQIVVDGLRCQSLAKIFGYDCLYQNASQIRSHDVPETR